MKKILKRALALTLLTAMLFATTVNVFALDSENPGDIQSYAHDVCSGYTYHFMVAHGESIAVNSGGQIIDRFYGLYLCQRCGLALAINNHPDQTGSAGAWDVIDYFYENVTVVGSFENMNRLLATGPKMFVGGILAHYRFQLPCRYPFGEESCYQD